MNDNVAPHHKYRVVVLLAGNGEALVDEKVDTPTEVNRIIHEIMGVRIGQWQSIEIHIEKKEF